MLEQALKTGKPHTRDAIMQALGVAARRARGAAVRLHPRPTPATRGALETVYVSAIEALGRVAGDERVGGGAEEVLYRGEWWAPDRTARLRAAAARALRAIGSPERRARARTRPRRRVRAASARRQGRAGRTGAARAGRGGPVMEPVAGCASPKTSCGGSRAALRGAQLYAPAHPLVQRVARGARRASRSCSPTSRRSRSASSTRRSSSATRRCRRPRKLSAS